MNISPLKPPGGATARKCATCTEEEVELLKTAREYSETQKRKTVKWFVSHGPPLPTEEEINAVVSSRRQAVEDKKRAARVVDRERQKADKSKDIVVPSYVHPMYSAEPPATPSFATVAANGMAGRKHLADAFANLCWNMLLRNRVESRLAAAAKVRAATAGGAHLAGTTRKRSSQVHDVLPITLLSMPEVLPRLEGQLTTTTTDLIPSSTNIERFLEKPLKVPFEFKLKDYRRVAFAEHHFANADPEVPVGVLPAGTAEVAEDGRDIVAEVTSSKATVPTVEHFSQPLITLESYPLQSFPFAHTDPTHGLIEGKGPQKVDDGGFLPPHPSADYNHFVPTSNRPLNAFQLGVARAPLPQTLKRPSKDDELSDTDDDQEVDLELPTSLDTLVEGWLPSLRRNGGGSVPPSREQQHHPSSTAAERSSVAVVAVAAAEEALGPQEQPVHRIGRCEANAASIARRRVMAEATSSIIAQLPEPAQKPF